MERTLLIFEESIKSSVTRKNYSKQLERFFVFTKMSSYDELVNTDTGKLQEMVEDYVIHLKSTINPNSVATYMTGVKHFFVMNRIKVFWDIIQKMYPSRVKSAGQKAWSDEDIAKMLEFNVSLRNKAIIHFMASTGARIGVHNYPLEMQHLKDVGDGVMAVLIYAGEHDEYWSFLTPEAVNYLQQYHDKRKKDGEIFTKNTPIFLTERGDPHQVRRNAVISMVYRSINRPGITRTRINKNFDIQMDHGFRKRFNIILKLDSNINSNITEKIMGHSSTIQLDNHYLPATDPRVFEQSIVEFKKAVLELTIDKSAKKDAEIKKLANEKSELERANIKYHQADSLLKETSKKLRVATRVLLNEDKYSKDEKELLIDLLGSDTE